MTIWEQMRTDFTRWVNKDGVPISVQNRKLSFTDSDYDDGAFASSGTAQTGSAFFQPIASRRSAGAGEDARFIEQGLVTQADMKLYIPSGIEINEKATISGTSLGGNWTVIDKGIHTYPNESQIVYKRVFIRAQRP